MRHLLTYIILAAASLLLTACHIYDDYMYGPDGEQKVRVSFVLALGSSDAPFTKAETWSPVEPDGNAGYYAPKDIGDSFDNMISNLQVVFYDAQTDRYYSKVKITGYQKIDSQDSNMNLYRFSGDMWVDEDDLDKEFKMMVFTNMDHNIQPWTSMNDLEALVFDTEGLSTKGIPMWGVQSVTLNQMKESDVTVYVLRAMAKVEVKLGEAPLEEGYTLSSMTMNNLNTSGYVLPHGAISGSRIVAATEVLSLDGLRIRSSHADAYTVSGDKARSLVMYVPEYDNLTTPAMAAKISLVLNKGEGVVYKPSATIEFKGYVDGRPSGAAYDIRRNHNYVFEINQIKVGEEGLKFIVDIEDLELGGRYGFEF